MWLCLNCGMTVTEDEADNIMVEYGIDAPCCCGGAMVRENPEDAEILYEQKRLKRITVSGCYFKWL